jgi:hypothetical protein
VRQDWKPWYELVVPCWEVGEQSHYGVARERGERKQSHLGC